MRICLVVPRTAIGECQRSSLEWVDNLWIERLLNEEAFFAEREFMEKTSKYVQVIPYTLIYTGVQTLSHLMYRRASEHTEQRLANNWSLGFGGHIDPEDLKEGMSKYDLIAAGRKRELQEELGITTFRTEPDHEGCLLNDLSDEVGSVHLGVVEMVRIEDKALDPSKFASEIDTIQWIDDAPATWTEEFIEQFEGWSQILIRKLFLAKEDADD